MSVTLHLNCWLLGDDASQVFPVAISKTATVGILKIAIKEQKTVAFQHVDANDLALWKVSIPVDDGFDANVELENKPALLPVKRLSRLFPDQPDDQDLHIIIQSPCVGVVPRLDHPTLELNCLIYEDDASHIFPVKIASTESVDTLTLWKVSILVDDSLKENVKKVEEEEMLSPVRRLSHIFFHPPQDGYLHIVVQERGHGQTRTQPSPLRGHALHNVRK
ncbi:uncharacterized protein EI90DRAFT_3061127 [Cantharellus anzutake]|uniref:uncharacterized protein n=1 Tax=Cantharellus anzutake TaxID=1750568 RepID=UPI001908377D|nr:uncharacterized protein EI90DRAFT_3061127 [Cantharellus anzutake]KAF8329975.1 hypothetical protein EI90DRAFT_3061127 [Cantharellus anzutake]